MNRSPAVVAAYLIWKYGFAASQAMLVVRQEKPAAWFGRTVIRSCCRLDYGTAYRMVDGSITEPLMTRPFQSLIQCCDAAPSGVDGSLRVLPGFHGAAIRYFQLAGIPPPEGGFFPRQARVYAKSFLLPPPL